MGTCIHCGHLLEEHAADNDSYTCTFIYTDPLTDENTWCTCTRTCCLEEYCPKRPEYQGHTVGWGGNPGQHVCCLCI